MKRFGPSKTVRALIASLLSFGCCIACSGAPDVGSSAEPASGEQCELQIEQDGTCTACSGECHPYEGGIFCTCPNDYGMQLDGMNCHSAGVVEELEYLCSRGRM